ncbi:ion channel [Primorskyibacter sp. S87]|uniref:ion channel n=1 Tax=Primorskyibacter sp. S87 TaxID=3415126 RepID=UPI003C7B5A7E
MPESTRSELMLTMSIAFAMILISSGAFYALSHLSDEKAGDTAGALSTMGLSIFVLIQLWLYSTKASRARSKLILMGVSFIQVVPFLFAAVYGSFGYYDLCVLGAKQPNDVLYFSYVTFTTLGFGDLQPVGYCRAISVAEAICGYILLGLFVAAAVGVYSRNHGPGHG